MTWIMDSLGSYYSKFSPEPDMDEWINGLVQRYQDFSDAEKDEFGFSEQGYLVHVSRKLMYGFGEVESAEWPEVIRLKRTYKSLPDLFHVWYGIMMVSSPMRSLLEKLDPGIHEFLDVPFDYPTEETFYVFHSPTSLNAILPEQSDRDCVRFNDTTKKYESGYGRLDSAGIVFDSAKTEGRAFWRDFTLTLPCYCISDAFKQSVNSLGLSFPKVFATRATV